LICGGIEISKKQLLAILCCIFIITTAIPVKGSFQEYANTNSFSTGFDSFNGSWLEEIEELNEAMFV